MRKRNWLKGVGGVTGRSQLAEGGVPGVEQLEARVMLNAAPQDDRYATHTINWNGRAVEVVRDSWVLTFHNEQTRQQVANRTVKVAEFFGLQPERIETTALGMFSSLVVRGQVTEAMAQAAVQHFPWLRLVEPNRVYQHRLAPNDAGYPFQWGHNNTGLEFPDSGTGQPAAGVPGADIDAELAWNITTGTDRVVIAVIDTGVAFQTENGIPVASDLKQTAWTKPYDFITNRAKAYDDHGHGTHVAGTIAQSTNNGHGVAGIAFEATIMPLKVLTAQGYGTVSDIADAVHFAADNGAQVINMSLGGPRSSPVLRKACTYAYQRGVTIVCAAGNSGHEGVSYPAAYPECMAVSAVGPSGKLTFYSSWGKEIDIAAPGGEYQSPDRKADGILQNTVFGKQDVFEAWQGTSMASPHVAGVAALVIGQGVKGPEAVRKRLRDTARPKDDPNRYGAGLLDAAAAVAGGSEAVLVANTQRSIPWPVLALGLLLATWLLPGGGANTTVVRFSAAAPVAIGLSLPPAGLAANLACCAVWPLLLLLVGWGVRPARPALTGVLAGFAVGCALRLTSGAVLWPALNAAVAYGLARLAARPD